MAIVGREAFADIVLPFQQVSSRHACLTPLGAGRYRVVDLGSSNGTYVSGRRVEASDLREGEDLRFGSLPFDWQAHKGVLDAEAALPQGMLLGRDPSCDLVVADGRVSSRHLRVIPQGHGLLILDLGSANGVTVNGRPVSKAVITASDSVRLGSMEVNIPTLVARRSAPAPQPVAVAAPVVYQAPSREQPAAAPEAPPAKKKSAGLWIGLAAGLVLLLGGGVAFATREDVVVKCELQQCPTELFHEKAYFWQANDVRTRADAARTHERWCPQHANEPIPVVKTFVCRHCGKQYASENLTKARREAPTGTIEDATAYCPYSLEPVTVTRTIRCQVCKRAYDHVTEMKPRHENPRDTEEEKGYCSPACEVKEAAYSAGNKAVGLAEKILKPF